MIKNSLRVANRQGVQRIANLSRKMSRQFAILNKPILEFCLHIICKNVNIIFKLYMDIFSEAQCGFGVEYIRRVARPQRESWGIQVFAIYTVIFIVLFFTSYFGILQVLTNQFDTEEILTFSYWKIKNKIFVSKSKPILRVITKSSNLIYWNSVIKKRKKYDIRCFLWKTKTQEKETLLKYFKNHIHSSPFDSYLI